MLEPQALRHTRAHSSLRRMSQSKPLVPSTVNNVDEFHKSIDLYLNKFQAEQKKSHIAVQDKAHRRKLSSAVVRAAENLGHSSSHHRQFDSEKMQAMLTALRYFGEECMLLYRAYINIPNSSNFLSPSHSEATLEALGRYAQALKRRGKLVNHPKYSTIFRGILADMSFVLSHMDRLNFSYDYVPIYIWNMMFDACANAPGGTCTYALQHFWDAFCRRRDLVKILDEGVETAANMITMNTLVNCAANMRDGARRNEVESSQGHFHVSEDNFYIMKGKYAEKLHVQAIRTRFESHLQANANMPLGASDPQWADEILEIMRQLQFPPTLKTYNRVLACYANSKMSESDLAKTDVTLDRLKEAGYYPNIFTTNALIMAAAGVEPRTGKQELAEYHFHNNRQEDDAKFEIYVNQLAKGNDVVEEACTSATLFVSGLSSDTTVSELRQAFEKWVAVESVSIVLDKRKKHVAFIRFRNELDARVARVKMNGVKIGDGTLYTKLKKQRNNHQRNQESIVQTKNAPNSNTLLGLLRAYAFDRTEGSEPYKSWDLIGSMSKHFGIPPSVEHFTALLQAFANERGGCVMRNVGLVRKEMVKQEIPVTEEVVASYIECCANARGGSPKGSDMVLAETAWNEALELVAFKESEHQREVTLWSQRGTVTSNESLPKHNEGKTAAEMTPVVSKKTLCAMLKCCANAPQSKRDWGKRAEVLFLSQLKERQHRRTISALNQERRYREWLSKEKEYRIMQYGLGGNDWIDKGRSFELYAPNGVQVNGTRLPQEVLWESRERARWRRDFLSWEENRTSESVGEDVFAELIRATGRTRPDYWFEIIRNPHYARDQYGAEMASYIHENINSESDSQTDRIRPSLKIYNAWITTLSKFHSLESTLAAYNEMQRDGVDPDSETFCSLICAHLKSVDGNSDSAYYEDNVHKAISLLDGLLANRLEMDFKVYDSVIEAFNQAAELCTRESKQSLLAQTDRLYAEAVRLELYTDLESNLIVGNGRIDDDFGVLRLEGKPIGVAKAAIRYMLGLLRQNPALAGQDILVYTDKVKRKSDRQSQQKYQILHYLKEELSGPAAKDRRDDGSGKHTGTHASVSSFWFLNSDLVRWCAWPPRQANVLSNLTALGNTPGSQVSMDVSFPSMKNIKLSPPELPEDGEGVGKFQVVSKLSITVSDDHSTSTDR